MINLFVANAIFNNYQANVLCDEICSVLATSVVFPTNIALSGKAAYNLQGGITTAVSNIIFRVDDLSKYFKLADSLSAYNIRNFQKFDKRLMFNYQAGAVNLCVEIWYSETPVERVLQNNIYLEKYQNIPQNLL